ncbi:MAG: HEAT repeat domain-containing protein [Planctomycetota bacterium]|nr:HEAT repeat domain-containing protein [Planctomycetota bacterium]
MFLRSTFINSLRRALPLLLCVCCASARAVTIPPPPDPGLEVSLRGADAIVEAEVLAGGPFRSVVRVLRALKGKTPEVLELEGYNSVNWDSVHAGFAAGDRYILFLSATGRPGVYSTLTPAAPRLAVTEDGVNLILGDPAFTVPVEAKAMETALGLVLEAAKTGKVPDAAMPTIQAFWDKDEVERRYLAVALAGWLREPRAVPLAAEAAAGRLLRLRLTGIEALQKIGAPEALDALRPLVKDRRETVSREAARALIALRDLQSVPPLLEWAQRAAAELPSLPAGDARRVQSQRVLASLFFWLDEEGALPPSEQIVPPLFDLARSKESAVASDALFVLGTLARNPQIQDLIDLADDPVFERRGEARLALFRATSRPVDDLDRFRAWWKERRENFGEDHKRLAVESAIRVLSSGGDEELQKLMLGVLRASPGEIALVSAAPLLLREKSEALFETADLAYWRTPLVLPFLLERLGDPRYTERRAAVDAAAFLATRYPRARALIRPFARAALCDDYSGLRRSAALASGRLQDARAVPFLIQLVGGNGYEAGDAGAALYELTGRTLGYSTYEPIADELAAAERMAGWWARWSAARGPGAVWDGVVEARRAHASTPETAPEALERACLGADSRPSGAALGVLLDVRSPNDPFWDTLLQAARVRDRAHGCIGRIGAKAEHAPALARLLEGPEPQADLVRACALVALASLEDRAGGEPIVRWLATGPGQQAELPWKRLAVVLLGLVDGEPASRAYLAALAQSYAKSDGFAADETPLLRAALAALSARADGAEGLAAALEAGSASARETAARGLLMRGQAERMPRILETMAQGDRYTLPSLVRLAAPLLRRADLPGLRAMLNHAVDGARMASAGLLALRPDLAEDAAATDALALALKDASDFVREKAAEALGKAGAETALEPLAAALADPDSEVKAAAAEALAAIGNRRACMLAAMEARALYRLDPRWLRALGLAAGDDELATLLKLSRSNVVLDQTAGLDALGVCPRPEALARLLEVFRNDESKFATHAALALAQQGDAAVAALAEDLNAPQRPARARAVLVLAHSRAPSAAAALQRLAADHDPAIQRLAQWALDRRKP